MDTPQSTPRKGDQVLLRATVEDVTPAVLPSAAHVYVTVSVPADEGREVGITVKLAPGDLVIETRAPQYDPDKRPDWWSPEYEQAALDGVADQIRGRGGVLKQPASWSDAHDQDEIVVRTADGTTTVFDPHTGSATDVEPDEQS